MCLLKDMYGDKAEQLALDLYIGSGIHTPFTLYTLFYIFISSIKKKFGRVYNDYKKFIKIVR